MSIKTTCPECDKEYNLADTMEGKTVKCKGCGNPFTVESGDEASTAVAAKPANGKASATATRAAKPSVKKRAADDDDDDDDEESEAPPKKKGGMGVWLLVGGGLVAFMMLFVCGGGVIGAYFLFFRGNAVTKANFDKIKGGMSPTEVQAILGKPDKTGDTKALGLLGVKVEGAPKTEIWESGKDSITVSYINDKVATWAGVFDGATFAMTDPNVLFGNLNNGPKPPVNNNTPPSPNPDPNPNPPMPASRLTLDKFNQIKGGMNPAALVLLLGPQSQANLKPDPAAQMLVSERGTAYIWSDGADSITVNFTPDYKAVSWTGTIGGVLQSGQDLTYAVKSSTSMMSKDNYNKIMGGETEQQINEIFAGVNSHPKVKGDAETTNYDNAKTVTWQDSHGIVTVTFCNGKAAHWSGLIDVMTMETKTNQQFVVLKGNNPNQPANPGSKLTKAGYNTIVDGQTPLAVVAQGWGPPMSQGNNGKNPARDPGYRTKWVWLDGNGRVDVEVNLQGIITHKSEQNLK